MTETLGPLVEEAPRQPLHILEIGAGRADFTGGDPNILWQPALDGLVLADGDFYVGLDIGERGSSEIYYFPQRLELINDRARKEDIKDPTPLDASMQTQWRNIVKDRRGTDDANKVAFVQADGTQLPFPDASFNRVVMNNVAASGTSDGMLKKMLLEADRVLTDDGEIVIHDDLTPQVSIMEQLRAMLSILELSADESLIKNVSKWKPETRDWPRYMAADEELYELARKLYGFPNPLDRAHTAAPTLWIVRKGALSDSDAMPVPEVKVEQSDVTAPTNSSRIAAGLRALRDWLNG